MIKPEDLPDKVVLAAARAAFIRWPNIKGSTLNEVIQRRKWWEDKNPEDLKRVLDIAREALADMINAWPKMLEQQFYELTPDGNRITFPAIILPLPQEPRDE